MEFIAIMLIAAAVFGVCYLVDKAFTKAFRSKAQHRSGKAVRAPKRYGIFGVLLTVVGILAICVGVTDGWVLLGGGTIVLLMGIIMMTASSTQDWVKRMLHTNIGRSWVRSCTWYRAAASWWNCTWLTAAR